MFVSKAFGNKNDAFIWFSLDLVEDEVQSNGVEVEVPQNIQDGIDIVGSDSALKDQTVDGQPISSAQPQASNAAAAADDDDDDDDDDDEDVLDGKRNFSNIIFFRLFVCLFVVFAKPVAFLPA